MLFVFDPIFILLNLNITLFYFLIPISVGIAFLILGLNSLKQKHIIEALPTSNIRSIAMGLVEIYGEVIPGKNLLKSPFSGEDCVYYKYQIQELRHTKNHSYWATIKSGEERVNFYLKDDTGIVLVDPKGAKIEISKDYDFYSGWGVNPPQRVLDFLNSKNIRFENFFGINKQMRFVESCIVPGDKLYILGTAGDNPYVDETMAKTNTEDIMIQKGRFDKIYYISDKPEKEILNMLRFRIIVGLVVGIMCIVFSLIFGSNLFI